MNVVEDENVRKRKEPIPNVSEFQGNAVKKLIDKIRDHSFSTYATFPKN